MKNKHIAANAASKESAEFSANVQAQSQPAEGERGQTRLNFMKVNNNKKHNGLAVDLPRLVRFLVFPNRAINLSNVNFIEKDPDHEVFRVYYRDGMVGPLTVDEYNQAIKSGLNPTTEQDSTSD